MTTLFSTENTIFTVCLEAQFLHTGIFISSLDSISILIFLSTLSKKIQMSYILLLQIFYTGEGNTGQQRP